MYMGYFKITMYRLDDEIDKDMDEAGLLLQIFLLKYLCPTSLLDAISG